METAEKEIEKHSHSAKELEEYLKEKAKKHTYFKLYGTQDRLNVIYEKKKLYLSCGKDWNDPKDTKQLSLSEGHTYYARCFSFSKSENVAMWMLYSGMGDNGVMVSFRPKFLDEITKKVTYITLGCFSENKFEGKLSLENDDFELYLIDMLYVREDKNQETGNSSYHVKRHDETGDILDRNIVEALHLCRKHYEWNYENECRLILDVKRKIDMEQYTDAEIDFSEIDKNLVPNAESVTMTPKHQGDIPHGYQKSTLSDGLKWDLCLNCPRERNGSNS